MKLRLPLAIIVLLIATVGLARLFSGPEDDWVRNNRGEWVAHGHPAGPPPQGEGKRLPMERVLPWTFFVAFAAPLFFLRIHRPSNRLTYETALRDMRFLGYTGSSLVVLGVLTVIGIGAVMTAADSASDSDGPARLVDLLFLGLLAGWSGLCIFLGAVLFALKRMVNDHYQLERGRRELIEAIERLRGGERC
jgi:hypothetical protein